MGNLCLTVTNVYCIVDSSLNHEIWIKCEKEDETDEEYNVDDVDNVDCLSDVETDKPLRNDNVRDKECKEVILDTTVDDCIERKCEKEGKILILVSFKYIFRCKHITVNVFKEKIENVR